MVVSHPSSKTHVKLFVFDLFKLSATFNGECWSLIDKGMLVLNCLSSMFTKIYLTVAIVLYCYKKYSHFLWCFNGNSLSSVVSLFSRRKLCVFVSLVSFQLVKIANWFSFKCFIYWFPENTLSKHSCFFFTSEKIKYMISQEADEWLFTLVAKRFQLQ